MARVYADVNAELGPGWYEYGAFDSSLRLNEEFVKMWLLVETKERCSYQCARSSTGLLCASTPQGVNTAAMPMLVKINLVYQRTLPHT